MKKIVRYIFALFTAAPGLLIAQAPVANFSASATSICGNSYVESFTDRSTNNPTSWKWYFPGAMPDTSTLQNPTNVTYNDYGCYTVKLVVKNNSGSDSLTDSDYICLDTMPNIHIMMPDSGHVCEMTSATLTASGGTQYYWSGGQTTSTIETPPLPLPGYFFSLRVYNGACYADTVFPIIVDTPPRVGFKGDTSICVGDSTVIYVLKGYQYAFLWNTGSTADSIIVNGVTPGSYTYYVNITKEACVRDSAQITVRAHMCSAGLENYSDPLGIKISPNPSDGQFNFDFNMPASGTIEIYDITGQRIYQQTIQGKKTEINLMGQPDGMYFYRAISETGNLIGEGKIAIQKQ